MHIRCAGTEAAPFENSHIDGTAVGGADKVGDARVLERSQEIVYPFHGVARHVAENRLEVASADRVQRITGVGRILGFLGTESDVLGGKGPLGYGGKPVSVLGRLEGIGRENRIVIGNACPKLVLADSLFGFE